MKMWPLSMSLDELKGRAMQISRQKQSKREQHEQKP